MKKVSLLLVLILALSLFTACGNNSTIGVIGGADGPTSIIVGKDYTPAITPEEAVSIALSHAGLTADEVHAHAPEFELDDGVPQYEVEFHNATASYSYEINADTGEIISFEKEG